MTLVYPLPDEDLSGKRREDAIIEAARALNEIDYDLLKLEYPGSPEGCRRLAAVLDTVARPRLDTLREVAAGRARPWTDVKASSSA